VDILNFLHLGDPNLSGLVNLWSYKLTMT